MVGFLRIVARQTTVTETGNEKSEDVAVYLNLLISPHRHSPTNCTETVNEKSEDVAVYLNLLISPHRHSPNNCTETGNEKSEDVAVYLGPLKKPKTYLGFYNLNEINYSASLRNTTTPSNTSTNTGFVLSISPAMIFLLNKLMISR